MITVVTPAINTRFDKLRECIDSVNNQTLKPKAHLICVDHERIGCANTLNNMIEAVDTEFFFTIADDDILYPNCLQRVFEESEGYDFIYPWCNVVGRGNWNPNSPFDADRLRKMPYIPSVALIRTEAYREVGGFPDVICEDYEFQIRLLNAGKKFKHVPEKLWEYRFHGSNISDGNDPRTI